MLHNALSHKAHAPTLRVCARNIGLLGSAGSLALTVLLAYTAQPSCAGAAICNAAITDAGTALLPTSRGRQRQILVSYTAAALAGRDGKSQGKSARQLRFPARQPARCTQAKSLASSQDCHADVTS
jgi:hypothetical protein